MISIIYTVAAALLFTGVCGKKYDAHDPVLVIANKVAPHNNPTETYKYYSLPFCKADGELTALRQKLGETLSGDSRVAASLYEVNFLVPIEWRSVCKKVLTLEEVDAFAAAVEDQVYFEMFVDDLPVWGYVGEVEGEDLRIEAFRQLQNRVFLYPHINFVIGYNGNEIVSADVTTDSTMKVDITPGKSGAGGGGEAVHFSYSVKWVSEPGINYSTRTERYIDKRFLPSALEIHWLTIINSVILILLLLVFLVVIMMRVLRNDFSRYMQVEGDELAAEDSGWKLVRNDVFRFPVKVNLFSSLLGSGAQLTCCTMLLLLCATGGVFKPTKRGSVLTNFISLYVLSSFIGGFVSARMYRQLNGGKWVQNCLLTCIIFPGPLFLVFCIVNSIAWVYGSTARLPFPTVIAISLMWLLIDVPLCILGSIVGRNTTGDFKAPCRTTKAPREIPKELPWFGRSYVQFFISGFLPFSAIFVELNYVFASVWGRQIYTLFGVLTVAFVLLLIVTSFVSAVLVYFQLAAEDHRWWWRTLIFGASSGLFIYAYSFFFFYSYSSMDGLLQGSYYFGYMAVISYAFSQILGFVAFFSSLSLVKHIYSAVKCD